MEVWKEIPGFNGNYQVSNMGRIKSLITSNAKILKGTINDSGYVYVNLKKNKKNYCLRLHRVVADAFISNSMNYPEINHIDGDKSNNRASNLEWCSRSHNMKHAYMNGLMDNKGNSGCSGLKGVDHFNSKLTSEQVIEIRKMYESGKYTQPEIANIFLVTRGCVSNIVYGLTWKHVK